MGLLLHFFQCNAKSTDTAFIQNNPLLDDLVGNHNPHEPEDKSDAPLFYTDTGGRFSTIAVDVSDTDNIDDNIYYIGTGMLLCFFFVVLFDVVIIMLYLISIKAYLHAGFTSRHSGTITGWTLCCMLIFSSWHVTAQHQSLHNLGSDMQFRRNSAMT